MFSSLFIVQITMSTRSRFLSIVAACISFAAISTSMTSAAKAASFEIFSLSDGKSLNTANDFSTVDGQPRMSIWSTNPNAPYQQFTRFSYNNGTIQLKHQGTGKCLNAAYLRNGGPVNVWNCNSNDPAQRFVIQYLDRSQSYFLIKRAGTNLCVDSPTRDNRGLVHLINCDVNNRNQRWSVTYKFTFGPSGPLIR
jgi:hypothetical protein